MKQEEIERLRFRRQYLLVPEPVTCPFLHKEYEVTDRYRLYAHIDLKVTTVQKNRTRLFLLGDLFDYRSPSKTNPDILSDLSVYGFREILRVASSRASTQEVPSNDSKATGQAVFKLNKAGDELSYRLIVAHLENVLMSHIHVAPAGENGPVVAWLYPSAPQPALIPGFSNGILQTGVITADDLVGDLSGEIRGQISANGLVE